MRTPALYRFTRAIVRLVVRLYFRQVEITGLANLPRDGPLILAANHPQSITDALILGLVADRMLCYLAHSGLFRNPIERWFLRNCGVIPVYRSRDVSDSPERNVEMFSSCYGVLEEGGAIAIFPEGTSGQERRVRRLKTGAARIALQCESRRGWGVGVVMVPVGINFESRGRFRSRVLVGFGERIHPSDFRGLYERDSAEAVRSLTEALEVAIRRRVVDIGLAEYERFVRHVERVYKEEVLAREGKGAGTKTRFERAHTVAQEIPRALEYFLDNKPDVIHGIRVLLESYQRRMERLRLDDAVVRAGSTTMRTAAIRFAILGLLGLPLALYSAALNALPYKLTGIVAKRLAPDYTKLHFYQIATGTVLCLLYYPPLFYLAHRAWGLTAAIVLAATVVPSGLFVRRYARLMRERRNTLRLAWLQLTRGYAVAQLRARRARLIHALDAAFDEYVVVRAGGVVGGRGAPEE